MLIFCINILVVMTIARLGLKMKVIGQGQQANVVDPPPTAFFQLK